MHMMGMSVWNDRTLRLVTDAVEQKMFGRLNKSRFYLSANLRAEPLEKGSTYGGFDIPFLSLFEPVYTLAEDRGPRFKTDEVKWYRRTLKPFHSFVEDYKSSEEFFRKIHISGSQEGLTAFSDNPVFPLKEESAETNFVAVGHDLDDVK